MEHVETEIKLRLESGPQAAAELLERRGYRIASPRTLQIDRVFDWPDGALRRSGRLLRIRSEGGTTLLTYKGPPLPGRHKRREELEAGIEPGTAMEAILDRLGYVPSFRYEKYRTIFAAAPRIPQEATEPGIIALDETPIGAFLELEGPEYWIDRTARQLAFSPQDYITASYAALYRDYLVSHPGPPDMVF